MIKKIRNLTPFDEQEIVRQCIARERSAQYSLYNKYSHAMYNICCRMVPKKDEAEEVIQDAFITVFEKIDTFSFQSTLGAWIKRIVINKCIDHLRLKRSILLELDEKMNSVPEIEDEIPDINIQVVTNAISELPDGYRTIFNLYALEGYDHEEIGQILGISEQTSKSQYHRAKEKLKKILIENGSVNKLYN